MSPMTKDETQAKIDELKKVLEQLVNVSRQEIAKRQQDFQDYVKSQQKNVDNLEGRIAAYQEILNAKPKEAALEDAVVTEQNPETKVFEPKQK